MGSVRDLGYGVVARRLHVGEVRRSPPCRYSGCSDRLICPVTEKRTSACCYGSTQPCQQVFCALGYPSRRHSEDACTALKTKLHTCKTRLNVVLGSLQAPYVRIRKLFSLNALKCVIKSNSSKPCDNAPRFWRCAHAEILRFLSKNARSVFSPNFSVLLIFAFRNILEPFRVVKERNLHPRARMDLIWKLYLIIN